MPNCFPERLYTLFAHHHWRSGSVSPHPCRHLVVSLFFILAIHSDRCIVIFHVVLTYIPLLTNDWFPAGSAMKNPPAMQETDVRFLGGEDPLEKERATHCSILAWRVLWTEGPGRLQCRLLQRVRHDWETYHSIANVIICWETEPARGNQEGGWLEKWHPDLILLQISSLL